jgi:DNA ligase-1
VREIRPATLSSFAAIGDAAAGTSSKLAKQAILADYLRSLDDTDLPLAVRYAAGRTFAVTDERVIGVSGAAVGAVLQELTALDGRTLHHLVVKHGEIGEAIATVWDARPAAPPPREDVDADHLFAASSVSAPAVARVGGAPPLLLREIASAFDQLAATGNQARKRAIVRSLFVRCAAAREAAYLSKIIFGDLRTGVAEGVLQAAVAQAFGVTLAQIQQAQQLAGDLGDVALFARHGRLDSATFALFAPVQFMLASPVDTAAEAEGRISESVGGGQCAPGSGESHKTSREPRGQVVDTAGATSDPPNLLAANGTPLPPPGAASSPPTAPCPQPTYLAEDKLDGIRAQVHKRGDRVAIYTRTMDRTDDGFPDVVAQVLQIPGDLLLDGEIVPMRGGKVLPFASIQKRLGRKNPPASVLRDHPAVFVAFDLLYRDGELLMGRPLAERRAALADLQRGVGVASARGVGVSPTSGRGPESGDTDFGRGPNVGGTPTPHEPPAFFTQPPGSPLPVTIATPVANAAEIDAAFAAARERGNEGLMLKDPSSVYSPGRRGLMWLKLKSHLPTLDCVVVAAEWGNGRRRKFLSDYTFAVWDRDPALDGAQLVTVGKAYSGLTDAEIAQLTERFESITLERLGRVQTVRPQVVLEIAFDTIQPSDRHTSGYALRFPRIKRIRDDKRIDDADRLPRVIELYHSPLNTGRRDSEPSAPASAAEPGLFG